jgi:hypothetical protein
MMCQTKKEGKEEKDMWNTNNRKPEPPGLLYDLKPILFL